MKKNIIILFFLIIGGIVSCSDEKKVSEELHEEVALEIIEEVDGLSLNNGEKWVANAETHEGMMQIRTILESINPLSLDDYHLMGQKCDEQTSFIISNCSMKGEPHNQLHFVLHPILDDIDGLLNAETMQDANDGKTALEKNISDYFTFFKVEK